jgi:BlaI family penicillinase repressor
MKRLPDSELELMLIIWNATEPVSRTYIQQHIKASRELADTTVLSFLSRLEKRDFIHVEKRGKTNYYSPIVKQSDYIESEGSTLLDRFFGNSITKFVAHFSNSDQLSQTQIEELKTLVNQLSSKELDK